MISWAKSKGADWGTIDTLPEIPGLALYKDGHAGYHKCLVAFCPDHLSHSLFPSRGIETSFILL